MNVLKFLIIIVLIVAKSERILSADSTTAEPTTAEPTTAEPTTAEPTTAEPTTAASASAAPTSEASTTAAPTSVESTTADTTAETTEPPPACVVPKSKCYQNGNGFCRTFATHCDAQNGNCGIKKSAMKWIVTKSGNCNKRKENQVKCCYNDCAKFATDPCTNAGKPVCGSSFSLQKIRLFASLCAMKKVSCKDPALKDWRVFDMYACIGLKPNGPAVNYPVPQ